LRNRHAIILPAVALAAAALGAVPPPEDFNASRLRAGEDFYAEKRYAEAIDQFRVAAFGYLDQPAALSECLIRLSLAEAAAGKTNDAEATLLRFLEVERSFPSYPPAGLSPEISTEFRTLLLRRVPEATLLSIPSLASLVETEEQKLAHLPAAQRRTALEARARREPASPTWPVAIARDALEQGDAKEAEQWASKALAIQSGQPEALAIRARARMARKDCTGALQDLNALPPSEVERRPELTADRFVCLVEVGDWPAAERVAATIPPSLSRRPDVARASQKLASTGQRRGAAAGSASAAASKAAASKPPAPPPTQAQAQGAGPKPAGGAAPAPAPPPAARPSLDPAAQSRAALDESRRLVYAGRASEAERLLTSALQADEGNRDLRLALLEAACLGRAYPTAAAQIPLVQPFAESEAPSMFYAAVVLYETGRVEDAQSYLRRAKSRVSGPLVDEYSRKILGTP
jgi:tetratricopeptide (TPR) repeat protein